MTIDPEKLRAALQQLDPNNDEHWTTTGKPAVSALETLLGEKGITRKLVDEAAPGYERPVAPVAPPLPPLPVLPPAPPPAAAVVEAAESASDAVEEDDDLEDDEDEDEDEEGPAPLSETAPDAVASMDERAREAGRIQAEIYELRAGRRQLAAEIDMAKGRLAEMDQQLGGLQMKLERVVPPMTDAQRIREVNMRALDERRKRAEAARAFTPPSNRSPIDQAMRNSGQRALGSSRPTYPGTPRPPKGKQG